MTRFARRSTAPSLWIALVGLSFAASGIRKLVPEADVEATFHSWGWTRQDMQIIGASEAIGAAMLVTRSTQRLGALLLSATSFCLMTTELRHGDDSLVTPRTGLFLAALTGFVKGR